MKRLLVMSLTRTVAPLQLSRRTLALALLVAFAAGTALAVWLCVLIVR
jgi:hypothetical protein